MILYLNDDEFNALLYHARCNRGGSFRCDGDGDMLLCWRERIICTYYHTYFEILLLLNQKDLDLLDPNSDPRLSVTPIVRLPWNLEH